MTHVAPTETSSAPESGAGTGGPRRPRWLRASRWLLGLAFIIIAVHLLASDPAPLRMLGAAPLASVVAIALLMGVNQALMAWRLQLAMKTCSPAAISWKKWFRLTSVGQFLNLFVPQLGHVYRAWALEREHRLAYAEYAFGLALLLWFELTTGIAVAFAVVATYDPAFRLGPVPILLPLASALVMLALAPLAVEAAFRLPSARLRWRFLVREGAHQSFSRARLAVRRAEFLARYVGVNLLATAVQMGTLALAFGAVGGALPLGRLMLFQVLLKLTNIILITPGNLGLTELAYGVLAEASASGLQHGLAAALLMRGLGTLVMVGLGVGSGGIPVLRRASGSKQQARLP